LAVSGRPSEATFEFQSRNSAFTRQDPKSLSWQRQYSGISIYASFRSKYLSQYGVSVQYQSTPRRASRQRRTPTNYKANYPSALAQRPTFSFD
jgi:hypothetical protein